MAGLCIPFGWNLTHLRYLHVLITGSADVWGARCAQRYVVQGVLSTPLVLLRRRDCMGPRLPGGDCGLPGCAGVALPVEPGLSGPLHGCLPCLESSDGHRQPVRVAYALVDAAVPCRGPEQLFGRREEARSSLRTECGPLACCFVGSVVEAGMRIV